MSINNCPVCGCTPAVDFEEHMIYCTGCSISVQDTSRDLSQLTNEWNSIAENMLKNMAKNIKPMPPEFIKLVNDDFWNLI